MRVVELDPKQVPAYAARIAAACRDVGHDRLISASLATLLPGPPGVYPKPMPPNSLRGKRDPVALFAIETAKR